MPDMRRAGGVHGLDGVDHVDAVVLVGVPGGGARVLAPDVLGAGGIWGGPLSRREGGADHGVAV